VNLGNPGEFTVHELAEMVRELVGADVDITYRPLPQDDPRMRRPVIDLAAQMLDFAPKVALRDGLVRTIAYFARRAAVGARRTPSTSLVRSRPVAAVAAYANGDAR
jgi:UDP-glucuronate decarboxylase